MPFTWASQLMWGIHVGPFLEHWCLEWKKIKKLEEQDLVSRGKIGSDKVGGPGYPNLFDELFINSLGCIGQDSGSHYAILLGSEER